MLDTTLAIFSYYFLHTIDFLKKSYNLYVTGLKIFTKSVSSFINPALIFYLATILKSIIRQMRENKDVLSYLNILKTNFYFFTLKI